MRSSLAYGDDTGSYDFTIDSVPGTNRYELVVLQASKQNQLRVGKKKWEKGGGSTLKHHPNGMKICLPRDAFASRTKRPHFPGECVFVCVCVWVARLRFQFCLTEWQADPAKDHYQSEPFTALCVPHFRHSKDITLFSWPVGGGLDWFISFTVPSTVWHATFSCLGEFKVRLEAPFSMNHNDIVTDKVEWHIKQKKRQTPEPTRLKLIKQCFIPL